MPTGTCDERTTEWIVERLRAQAVHPVAPEHERLRPAAVLVPLVRLPECWHLLYTLRTETVQSHKGQVSFPGGAADPGETTPEETALREAYEEIGLLPDDVQLLGRLNRRPTISQFLVTPVVAKIRWPVAVRLSQMEVSRVFTIPLDWLADASHREERPRNVPDGLSTTVIYYEPYDGEILWGLSARITVDLLEALQMDLLQE